MVQQDFIEYMTKDLCLSCPDKKLWDMDAFFQVASLDDNELKQTKQKNQYSWYRAH